MAARLAALPASRRRAGKSEGTPACSLSCTEVGATSIGAQSSHVRVGEGQHRAALWYSNPASGNLHSPRGRRPPQAALGAAAGRANSVASARIAARAGWEVVATARQVLEADWRESFELSDQPVGGSDETSVEELQVEARWH